MLQAAAISSVMSKHLVFVSLMLNHQNVQLPTFPFPFLFPCLVRVLVLVLAYVLSQLSGACSF